VILAFVATKFDKVAKLLDKLDVDILVANKVVVVTFVGFRFMIIAEAIDAFVESRFVFVIFVKIGLVIVASVETKLSIVDLVDCKLPNVPNPDTILDVVIEDVAKVVVIKEGIVAFDEIILFVLIF
jgi:hypothetical protein